MAYEVEECSAGQRFIVIAQRKFPSAVWKAKCLTPKGDPSCCYKFPRDRQYREEKIPKSTSNKMKHFARYETSNSSIFSSRWWPSQGRDIQILDNM